jgi:hypothetical protein
MSKRHRFDPERYAKMAFDAHGLDSDEAMRLSDQLADDVLTEVTRAASNRLAELVGELNAAGHQLIRYESAPGDIEYRDTTQGDPCALRLGLFISVDSGYAHLTDDDGAPVEARHRWGTGSPEGNRE